MERLADMAAWRRRVFGAGDLDATILRHNTANLSYIERLELVNRVMVDVLLQAIPDRSSSRNTTHVEPPLLAPRMAPAYRRRPTYDEELKQNNSSVSPSRDVAFPASPTFRNALVENEVNSLGSNSTGLQFTSPVYHGKNYSSTESTPYFEKHTNLSGSLRPSVSKPKIVPIDTITENPETKDHSVPRNQSTDRHDSTNQTTPQLTFQLGKQNSSYLSVFGKFPRSSSARNSSSSGNASANVLHLENTLPDGNTSLTSAPRLNNSASRKTNEGKAPADLSRQSTNVHIRFSRAAHVNGQSVRNVGDNQNETSVSPDTIKVSEQNTNENLNLQSISFPSNEIESLGDTNVTEHNNTNDNSSNNWKAEIFIKIGLQFRSNPFGSTQAVLPRENNSPNKDSVIMLPVFTSVPERLLESQTLSSLLNSSIHILSRMNPSLSPEHMQATVNHPELLLYFINSSISLTALDFDNSSKKIDSSNQIAITFADQNTSQNSSRRPKLLTSDSILQEIRDRNHNLTLSSSDEILMSNYSRETANQNSTCTLQERWNKVEHLRRSIELLLLSMPVTVKEMMEASSHPYLDDFIFRPQGRSIFAMTGQCAECYMRDPRGKCREVLFCKNGASVSSRILG
ncbi:GATA zinc finger domain-containing protein 11-like [Hyalella azteca]|uniref:GATA zinc finger domain-containing protein 11-like n=1 Tax=Hyalella azteca TaxID=294128 RepID=A0A8B7P3D5_HYAAZ|nr:GATA zinc finger domain-containing protein 11-like [Hyalella azteca]